MAMSHEKQRVHAASQPAAAGARNVSFLAKALALLIEGAYTASQTYGPGSALMTALPKAAEALIDSRMDVSNKQ